MPCRHTWKVRFCHFRVHNCCEETWNLPCSQQSTLPSKETPVEVGQSSGLSHEVATPRRSRTSLASLQSHQKAVNFQNAVIIYAIIVVIHCSVRAYMLPCKKIIKYCNCW